MPKTVYKKNLHQTSIIYLKRQELEARYQVTKTTIYLWIKTRNFPKPIHFGANLVRWNSAHVDAWEVEKEAPYGDFGADPDSQQSPGRLFHEADHHALTDNSTEGLPYERPT